MDFLQFLGTISPALAPTLLISYVAIRLILEFLKERREMYEGFRLERKEWRESYETLLKQERDDNDKILSSYHGLLTATVAVERDIVNQMHALKNEIQKVVFSAGKKPDDDR